MSIYSCQNNGVITPTPNSNDDCKRFICSISNLIATATSDDDKYSVCVL